MHVHIGSWHGKSPLRGRTFDQKRSIFPAESQVRAQMRVLVVSSEPLNPDDTLGSTFELSQAKLLSKLYDVAILSVSEAVPIKQRLRAALKRRLAEPSGGYLKGLFQTGADFFKHVFGYREVRIHFIEGIAVYEGISSRLT